MTRNIWEICGQVMSCTETKNGCFFRVKGTAGHSGVFSIKIQLDVWISRRILGRKLPSGNIQARGRILVSQKKTYLIAEEITGR